MLERRTKKRLVTGTQDSSSSVASVTVPVSVRLTIRRPVASGTNQDYVVFVRRFTKVTVDDSYIAPFVITKFVSPNPDAKTIIFYNHYDTVPADGDQPWTSDPFTLSVHYGTMYGRGVDDDKGHITARLTAIRKYIREKSTFRLTLPSLSKGQKNLPRPIWISIYPSTKSICVGQIS